MIRIATVMDCGLLAELGSRTFLHAFVNYNIDTRHIQSYANRMFTEVQLERELSDPETLFLIAEKRRRALGYTKIVRNSFDVMVMARSPAQLQRMYVDKTHHRTGIGRAMLKRAFLLAREYGHDIMWLNVGLENESAISFYEHFGFRRIDGLKSFQFGDLVLDAAFMVVRL